MPRALPVVLVAVFVLMAAAWQPAHDALGADGTWTGVYYNNLTLSGSPALSRDEGATLDLFLPNQPGLGVNADNWSARYERTDTYAAATYRITVIADDGVRVYVDGVLILDAWVDQAPTTYFVDHAMTAGSHTVRIELYDVGNAATIEASIIDASTIPAGWQGEYFDNVDLLGSPLRTRNDGESIEFTWNDATPGSPFPGVIPNDDFSARWTRTLDFNEGVYQFTTVSDDGVRVYVDGQLIIDYWIDQPPTEHSANKQMSAGEHTVVVEYYERGGGAMIFLDIDFRPDLGGFITETIVEGLPPYTPTAFAFAPDGRIFFTLKSGEVRVFKGGVLLETPYYTVPNVNAEHDRGLLGLALDPDFAGNGWVYLAYTYETNASDPSGPKTNQVIRVRGTTPDADVADPATKAVLLGSLVGTAQDPSCDDWPANSDCIPVDHLSHAIGNLRFGPDGRLYVATGDGASYTTVDSRALRTYDLTSLAGKILRVDPATGRGSADNPFYSGDPADNASKVWALGVRNDFRFDFKPGTDIIFSGDVGWDTWEEVNVITPGVNLGWPCYEGPFEQPGYAAFQACQDLYVAGGVSNPLHWYEHPPDSAAVGGDFTGSNGYSAQFQDTYFFGDYARDEISVLKVDGANNLISGSVDVFSSSADGPVQIQTGPEGDIYYLALNAGELRRIRYVGDNRPPVAVAAATPNGGLLPLTVNFSSEGSLDLDEGQALTYYWDFGDGASSTLANPTHEYTSAGVYTATLTVTDPLFRTGVDAVEITAGNALPVATITGPADGANYDIGDVIAFNGSASDLEDGTLSGESLTWSINILHCSELAYVNCHQHVESTPTGDTGEFAASDHGDFTFYELVLTVEDSAGLRDMDVVELMPNRVDLTFTSNLIGIELTVGSTAQAAPFVKSVPRNSRHTIFAASPQLVAGQYLYFSAWSDGGAQQHEITATASTGYDATFFDPPCPLFGEFLLLVKAWNAVGPPNPSENWDETQDFNGDNLVGFEDFLDLVSRWCD